MTNHIRFVSCCFNCFHSLIYISRINCNNHSDTHVVCIIHRMLINISIFCKFCENWRDWIAVFFNNCFHSINQHSWHIFIETTTCNMAACFYSHTCIFNAL